MLEVFGEWLENLILLSCMKERNIESNPFRQFNWKHPLVGATLFFVVNLILRSIQLTKNPLSGDEPFTLYHAQMQPGMIVSELLKGNNPPLFELLLHYWIGLKDISLQWVRILPLIFSTFTAFFLYLLANKIKKGYFPIFVSLIYMFSVYHLQFGQEIRVYSLFGCLTVISMWIFLKVWRDEAKLKWWIALVIVNSCMIYSHYFGFFLLLIQTILIFSDASLFKKSIQKYAGYVLAMILLYLPLIPVILHHFVFNEKGVGTWLAPASSIEDLYNMLWKFSNKPVVTVIGIAILLSAVVKYLLSKDKKLKVEAKLLFVWFIVSFFGMFVISFKIPMYLDRYLIYGSFSYILLLVYAIGYVFPTIKGQVIASAILVVLFGVTFSLYSPTKRNAPLISEEIIKARANGYSVILCPKENVTNFVYYYNVNYFKLVDAKPLYQRMFQKLSNENIFPVWHISEVKKASDKWLFVDVAASLTLPNNGVFDSLQAHYTLIKEEKLDEVTKAYYFQK